MIRASCVELNRHGPVCAQDVGCSSRTSQAVQLRKGLGLKGMGVEFFGGGEETGWREKGKGWARPLEILANLAADFFPKGQRAPPPQERGSHAGPYGAASRVSVSK